MNEKLLQIFYPYGRSTWQDPNPILTRLENKLALVVIMTMTSPIEMVSRKIA